MFFSYKIINIIFYNLAALVKLVDTVDLGSAIYVQVQVL